MKNNLSLRSVDKLLKKAGAKRTSDGAKKQFQKIIEEHVKMVSRRSISFSLHAKRKTIKKQDIVLASKN